MLSVYHCVVSESPVHLNKKKDDEKPPFYLLVRRLYVETQLLPIQRKLVSEGKLYRYQRTQVRSNQAILFKPLGTVYCRQHLNNWSIKPAWPCRWTSCGS